MSRITAVMCMVVLIAGTAVGLPTRFPYWQMVREVVQQIESRPPRPLSISDSLRTPGQDYPFEAFRHLRAADLLRAAQEGIEEAQLEAAIGRSEAEIEALARRNIAIALEYLPLVIRKTEDIETLLNAMDRRDEALFLRVFILERSVKGLVPPSLLSLTLPDLFADNEGKYLGRLAAMASHPTEAPEVQELAIRAYMQYCRQQYMHAFNSDPAVVSAAAAGEPMSHIMAVQVDAQVLSSDTKLQLRRLGVRMERFADRISGHISEHSVRDERVKQATRNALEEIRDTIFGVNREKLDTWLEGLHYEEPADLQAFPPAAAQPPTVDIPPGLPSLPGDVMVLTEPPAPQQF